MSQRSFKLASNFLSLQLNFPLKLFHRNLHASKFQIIIFMLKSRVNMEKCHLKRKIKCRATARYTTFSTNAKTQTETIELSESAIWAIACRCVTLFVHNKWNNVDEELKMKHEKLSFGEANNVFVVFRQKFYRVHVLRSLFMFCIFPSTVVKLVLRWLKTKSGANTKKRNLSRHFEKVEICREFCFWFSLSCDKVFLLI